MWLHMVKPWGAFKNTNAWFHLQRCWLNQHGVRAGYWDVLKTSQVMLICTKVWELLVALLSVPSKSSPHGFSLAVKQPALSSGQFFFFLRWILRHVAPEAASPLPFVPWLKGPVPFGGLHGVKMTVEAGGPWEEANSEQTPHPAGWPWASQLNCFSGKGGQQYLSILPASWSHRVLGEDQQRSRVKVFLWKLAWLAGQ